MLTSDSSLLKQLLIRTIIALIRSLFSGWKDSWPVNTQRNRRSCPGIDDCTLYSLEQMNSTTKFLDTISSVVK